MLQIASDTPLFEVVGARVPALRRLEKMGIKTVHDLLWHFPTRYEDFTKIYPIAELEPGQQATITGVVEEIQSKHSWRRAMSIVEATIADETGTIRAVWFNQPYVANVLKVGRMANFAGKASTSEEGEIYLNNPVYEVIHMRDAAHQEMNHTARLVPVYPETRGLTSRGIRFVTQALFRKKPVMKEWIPAEILLEFHFPELNEAIHSIHFPRQIEDATAARARFSFEELFLLQILNMQQKLKLATERAPVITADIEHVKAMLARLPFELTHSQKQSLWEIIKDIEKPRPMNRLLQGDVGSGKTVVAAIAALIAAENKLQTAFMAPTEILARQHFETMKKLFVSLALGGGNDGDGRERGRERGGDQRGGGRGADGQRAERHGGALGGDPDRCGAGGERADRDPGRQCESGHGRVRRRGRDAEPGRERDGGQRGYQRLHADHAGQGGDADRDGRGEPREYGRGERADGDGGRQRDAARGGHRGPGRDGGQERDVRREL